MGDFYSNFRGTVGVIKPTIQSGSLDEFIRLLPPGIKVIPTYLGIKTGAEQELFSAVELTKQKIAELAALEVDVIHAEGAPIFMSQGYHGERTSIEELEKKYGLPIFTSGMSQAEALRALGVKRFVGVTYVYPGVTEVYHENHTRYFTEAGFEVLAMEGLWAESFVAVGKLSSHQIYSFVKKQYKKFKNDKIDGIYLLGSFWRCLDVLQILEEDMGIPVVHPVTARVWAVQKRLDVRQRVKGYGRLLEEMP